MRTGTWSDDRVDLADPGPLDLDVAAIAALADRIGSTPIPHDDTQIATVAELVALASGLSSQSLRTRLEAVWALDDKYGHWGTERKSFPGAKGKWTSAFGPGGADALEALRADEIELGRIAHEALEGVKRHRRLLLGAIIGRFVLDGAAERASSGQLEFHDLLVLARRLAHRSRPHPSTAPRTLRTGPARRVPGHRPDPARDRRPPHVGSR